MHIIIGMWRYHLFKKVASRRLLNREQAFFIRATALPLYFGNQRVNGVVSLTVDKLLDVEPQIMVLRRDFHQQEGLQYQGLSGYWNKAFYLIFKIRRIWSVQFVYVLITIFKNKRLRLLKFTDLIGPPCTSNNF